jgi:malonate transporter MadL subunit
MGTPSLCIDMTIYGTALLAACLLLGILAGELLGYVLGVPANVGGVGIAMLLLIFARLQLHKRGLLNATSDGGVLYWSALYIPVVVAMAMQQNVVAALRGGPVALLAAAGSVALCGLFVSFINRMEPDSEAQKEDR